MAFGNVLEQEKEKSSQQNHLGSNWKSSLDPGGAVFRETESRARREPRDSPTLRWKICLLLLLLPGAGDPGEGTDPCYSQWVPTGALVGNSSGTAEAAANTPAEQAGVPHSKVSNTSCLSCTVFTKIGRYL